MRFSDIDRNPRPATLRQFAGVSILFFGGMAAWKAWSAGPSAGVYVLAALAAVIGISGLIQPRAVRAIFVGWMILAFPIGWVISHLLLAVAYYVVVLPIGLVFRLTGRDTLALRKPHRSSYWIEKPQVEDVSRYFLQY